jgi:osmotically-inducible protein OsmY
MDIIANERIAEDIRDELARDPRIPHEQEIAVESQDGIVTLRGTVGSFSQLRAAVDDARGAPGVFDVYDELKVRLLDEARRQDAEIRGAALQRLAWDPELPADDIDVEVNGGWLTLSGRVDHQFQSDLAFDHAATLYGVLGVTNDIKVVQAL